MGGDAVCFCGHVRAMHGTSPLGGCAAVLSDKRTTCRCRGFVNFEPAALEYDPIARPAHYTRFPGGAEPIQIAEHLSFNLGCALKYIARAGHKGDAVEDLRKARWYVEREIARLTFAGKEGAMPKGGDHGE